MLKSPFEALGLLREKGINKIVMGFVINILVKFVIYAIMKLKC